MATFVVTFGDTAITPGSTAPVVTAPTGGTDTLILDMSAAGSDQIFSFGQVLDVAGMESFPDHSGFFRWFAPVARYGVTFSGIEQFQISGGAANDFLVSGQSNDTMTGGAGNDSIFTKLGDAAVDGGTGTDEWSANFSDRTTDITVNLASNTMTGIEVLGYGSNSASNFRTGSGNDTIVTTALAESDYIDTGAGNDRVTLRGGVDTVDLGNGTDTLVLRYAGLTQALFFGVSGGNVTDGQFSGGAGFSVGFTGVERFDIQTGVHNDAFSTGSGNDTISTGDGNDIVNTYAGSIVLDMGAGTDRWGFDYRGSTANITIDIDTNVIRGLGASSVAGVEQLQGSTGDSNVYTGDGNDTVVTHRSAQVDFIVTGAGSDRVTVFAGADAVAMGTGTGDDDVLVVDYSGTVPTSPSDMSGSMFATGDGDHTFSAAASGLGVNATGVERLDYTGGNFRSFVSGGKGKDTLSGGNQDDSLRGIDGKDRVSGGAGNDMLNGGNGKDKLNGGAGEDTFVFDAAPGNGNADRVSGFVVAEDTLRLSSADFAGLALGALAAGAFRSVTSGGAVDADDRIVYDSSDGRLHWDADGAGGAEMVLFARLSAGLALTEADFLVIA
jgi:serralysin